MKKNLFVIGFLAFVFCFWATTGFAKVHMEAVDYMDAGQELQGFVFFDDEVNMTKPLPGVMVVHEWHGLSDYAKKRAAMLAKAGYVAFAVDMYGKGVFAETHEQAAELSGVFFKDREKMHRRSEAAYKAFIKTGKVDPNHIAAIGYCFGGTTVLEMARAGMPIKGVASFHGILSTPQPAQPAVVSAKVLVFNGAEDKMTSSQDIQTFQDEMRHAEADWQFVNLSGAKHSFTVWDANLPDKGIEYNKKADKRSWGMLRLFLKEVLAS